MAAKFLPQAGRLLMAAMLVVWPYARARPQGSTVLLTGTVTDSAGAAVPGATLKAANLDTGASFTATTDASGEFSLPLPPGRYRVVAWARGLSTRRAEDISVSVGEARRLGIVLSVGPTTAAPLARRVTGRSFLVGTEREEPGYGLYSYLLVPSEPLNEHMRRRFLAVIEAYLRALPDVRDLEAHVPRAQLNITYMLTSADPPVAEPDANWILSHYNFARARVLLSLLPVAAHNGPYILSTLVRLSQESRLPQHYLFQDMSDVPASMAGLWEQQFETQAENADFWKQDTRSQAVLRLRTLIANAAAALPEVRSSAAEAAALLGVRINWH